MASHIWCRAINRRRYDRMMEHFQFALPHLAGDVEKAAAFAGYFEESISQKGSGERSVVINLDDQLPYRERLLRGAIRSDFRFARRWIYADVFWKHFHAFNPTDLDWRPEDLIPEDYYA